MTDHLQKAGQEMTEQTQEAADAAANGDLMNIAQSAWQGISNTTQEVWRSIRKNTGSKIQRKPQDK